MIRILLIIALAIAESLGAVKTDTLKAIGNVLVVKDTLQADKGIRFSPTDSVLKTFKKGVMPCTVKTSDFTTQVIANAYWTKIGNVFTISMPRMMGVSNSTTLNVYCAFPYKPKQLDGSGNSDNISWLRVQDNGSNCDGFTEVPDFLGYISFVKSSGTWTNSGNKGIYYPFTITFITEN